MNKSLAVSSMVLAGLACATITPAYAWSSGSYSFYGRHGYVSGSYSGYGHHYGWRHCCYGAGVAAGAAAGLAVGTAAGVAAASRPAYVVAPPVVVAGPPVVVAVPPTYYYYVP